MSKLRSLPTSIAGKLVATAKKSEHPYYKHAACVIDSKGNAYSYQYNMEGKHNHAERRAYEHFNQVYYPQGRKLDYLIVIRLTKSGKNFAKSNPCKTCSKYFNNKGLLIVHST